MQDVIRTSQSQLGGGGDDAPRSYDDLLEEIDDLKAELEERPSQEVVGVVIPHPCSSLTAY